MGCKKTKIKRIENKYGEKQEPEVPKDPFFTKSTMVTLELMQFVMEEIKKQIEKEIYFNLCYKATVDGFTNKNFHDKCDQKFPIIVIIESEFGKIFGGFSDVPFYSATKSDWNKSNKCFLFSVDKQTIQNIKENDYWKAIYCDEKLGICFGNIDLEIHNNCNENDYSSTKLFGESYSLPEGIEYNTEESLGILEWV